MKRMLRTIATIVAAAVLLAAIGCAESEYRRHQKIEIEDHIIKQDTIVE